MVDFYKLTETDNQVLKLACEQAIKANSPIVVSTQSVSTEAATLNIPKEKVIESLEVLEGRGYIRFHDSSKDSFAIPDAAFESYAKKHIPNYSSLVETVLAHIVNDDITNNKLLAAQTNKPQMIIDHILKYQDSQHAIKVAESFGDASGPEITVYDVSTETKRRFRK
jgi:hypothetical protein